MVGGSVVRRGVGPVVTVLALLFTVSSCGGGDDSGSTAASADAPPSEEPADTATEPASSDGAAEEAAEPAPEASAGEKKLVVTIGGETYEADLSADLTVCISMGGAIGAAGPIPGIDGGTIDVDIPIEDYEASADEGWEPPSVRVDLGEDENGVPVDFRAGGDIVDSFPDLAGKSQVDSFSVDGTSASGTATFIDVFQVQLAQGGQVEEPQPMPGTFEVSCG